MLKLFIVFNSVQNISSKNMLQYFSTTTDVKKNVKNKQVMKNKMAVNLKFKNKTVKGSVNKSKINIILNNKQRKNSLIRKKKSVMFKTAKGVFFKKQVSFMGNWYNKQRSLNRNWFRSYYYERLPMIFRFYPFSYRKWFLRYFIIPMQRKQANRLFRIKLFRRNRRLLRLKRMFFYADKKLTKFKFNIITKLSTEKAVETNVNSVQWRQLLKINSERTNTMYNKYKKYVGKFTQWYLSNRPEKRKIRRLIVNKKHPLFKLRKNYMLHVKFYKAQQMYFNFRLYKYNRRHMKRIKWIYKKAYKKSLKRKTFTNLTTSLHVKNRVPYRFRRRVRSYKYKRFSYYWLRYFFKRFKQMYIDNNKNQTNYKDIKKYLLCWLWKVRTYKVLSLHNVNPARGFLLYKSNKLHNEMKDYGLFSLFSGYSKLTFVHDRNELDDMFKSIVNKNRYLYRNFYWRFYKSSLERRKAQILKRHYHYTWGLRPYIFVHKKQKVFYNWADRHIFKRYPLYRYKYTLFFKFPRYADYRRLFKNQLREQHVFRYLYRLKLSQLIKAFRKATYKTKRIFELMFLKYFELRLDTVVYRLNFAWSLKHARQLVLRGLFLVNNKVIDNHKYHVGLGDVIMPIKRLRMQPLSKKYLNYVDYGVSFAWTRLFYRPIQSDQYPAHFLLNERIPAGMVVNKFNPNNLRFNKPYSVQFLTLSLLKYN
jgi:ribosomal protein S4